MASEGNSMISFFLSFIFFILGLIMLMYAVGSLEYKGEVLEEDSEVSLWSALLDLG